LAERRWHVNLAGGVSGCRNHIFKVLRCRKQQNPPREEVRWVSLVLEGLLGGEETVRFDRAGRR
jgi:hypothetical protein